MGKQFKDDKELLGHISKAITILQGAKERGLNPAEKKKVIECCKSISEVGYDELRLQHLIGEYQKKLAMQIRQLVKDEIIKNRDQYRIDSCMGLIKSVDDRSMDVLQPNTVLNNLVQLDVLVKQHIGIVKANERVDRIIEKLIKDIRKAE